jgi:hypothetical protein
MAYTTLTFSLKCRLIFSPSPIDIHSIVPDRPLVRDPIKTLLEYPYELGVWDFDPVHILILIEV